MSLRHRQMLETLRAVSRGASPVASDTRATATSWGLRLYDRLHSRTASTVLRLFELIGIPLALVALAITVFEAQQSTEQTRLALAAAQEQLAESARVTLFDEEVDINERARSLATFAAIRSEVYPPSLSCPDICGSLRRLVLKGRPTVTTIYEFGLADRNIVHTEVTDVTFVDARFVRTDFGKIPKFVRVKFVRSPLPETLFKASTTFENVTFEGVSMVGTNVVGADLTTVQFVDVDVSGMILCGPDEASPRITRCAGFDSETTFAGAFFDVDNPPVGIDRFDTRIRFGGFCKEPELVNGVVSALAFTCHPDISGEGNDPGELEPLYYPHRPTL